MPILQQLSQPIVTKELMDAIEFTHSSARLRPYLQAAGHDNDRTMALYLWNAAVGQSFHFPLQGLEVSLRNGINKVLIDECGDGWWEVQTAPTFFNQRRIDDLAKTKDRVARRVTTVTVDDMVAGLTFGFWVGLLAPRYYPKLWSRRLSDVFPGLPLDVDHRQVYAKINKPLDIRNRIFHHEPLINENLSGFYSETMALLKWLCPETQGWIKNNCSVPAVLRNKP